MTPRGVLGAAAYLPHRRLDRTTIAAVAGGGGGKGTRTVASYDEDTTTMGVEAARLASRVVLSVPFEGVAPLLPMLASELRDRLLIETVVPLRVQHGFAELLPIAGGSSVGEWLHAALPGVRVVSAWKNVAAATLRDLLKRVGSSIVARKQRAVMGPTPGAVMNLRT